MRAEVPGQFPDEERWEVVTELSRPTEPGPLIVFRPLTELTTYEWSLLSEQLSHLTTASGTRDDQTMLLSYLTIIHPELAASNLVNWRGAYAAPGASIHFIFDYAQHPELLLQHCLLDETVVRFHTDGERTLREKLEDSRSLPFMAHAALHSRLGPAIKPYALDQLTALRRRPPSLTHSEKLDVFFAIALLLPEELRIQEPNWLDIRGELERFRTHHLRPIEPASIEHDIHLMSVTKLAELAFKLAVIAHGGLEQDPAGAWRLRQPPELVQESTLPPRRKVPTVYLRSPEAKWYAR